MKKANIYALCCIWFSCTFSFHHTFAQQSNSIQVGLPQYFYKKLEGTIGNEKIELDLLRMGGNFEGHFYYKEKEAKGSIIGREHKKSNGEHIITLEEHEGMNVATGDLMVIGTFEGKFINAAEFVGKWTNEDGTQTRDFHLKEEYLYGSARFEVMHEGRNYGENAETNLVYIILKDEKHKKVEKKINDFITSHLLDYMHPNLGKKEFKHHEEMLNDFIRRYKEEVKNKPNEFIAWENNHSIVIDYNNHNILAIEFVETVYEGGKEPKENVYYVNFDITTGNKIALGDILKEGYQAKLAEAAEKIFRKNYGFENIKSFKDEGIVFPNNKFTLPDNYSLSKGGILFRFNEDIIAPRSLHHFDIFIPYSEIREFIKEKSSLEEVIKNYY